jgi:magnesium-transporting ATPase (P-type)
MSKPTITQVFKSVLAAVIGVQSDANRKKDFEQGSLSTYIIAGLIFMVFFIAAIIFIVSIVTGA